MPSLARLLALLLLLLLLQNDTMDQTLQRLESVCARLEALAAKGGVGGGAGGAAAAGGADGSEAAAAAYDDFHNSAVKPYLASISALAEAKELKTIVRHSLSPLQPPSFPPRDQTLLSCSHSLRTSFFTQPLPSPPGSRLTRSVPPSQHDQAEQAFGFLRKTILVASISKKPSDADFAAYLAPLSKIYADADKNCDNRNPWFNFLKAFHESIQALSWVGVSLPMPHVKGQLEAADFFLSKILTAAKNEKAEVAPKFREFVKQTKAVMESLVAYIKANHTTGLTWNPKGKDFGAAKDSAPAAAAPAAAAAAGPAKPAVSMGAVFGDLSKGLDITKGLNKVTKDMKKDLKSQPVVAPKEHKEPAAAAAAAPKAAAKDDKPPVLELRQMTWNVENHKGNNNITLNDVQPKHSVYILRCHNTNVTVPAKVKSIQIDNCTKVTVTFEAVVSTVEVVNSKSITINALQNAPTVSVDKTQSCQIVLNEKSVQNPPQIFTANTQTINLMVPGKNAGDDPIELSLPDQFHHTYANWAVTSKAVKHG